MILSIAIKVKEEKIRMTKEEINKITHKIIGCAMEVHNQIGSGFQEVIYQRALQLEMEIQGLSYVREMEMELKYKGREIGTRRVDFFCSWLYYGRTQSTHKARRCP